MIETTKLLDDDATRLLKSLIGKTLDAFEAYIMFEEPFQAYKTVRLEFSDETAVDFTNEHQRLPLGPSADEEEVSILDAVPGAEEELWCPRNKDITHCSGIDLHVEDVLLVIDTAALTKGDIPVNKLKLVQAIAFREGPRLFVVDRDIWFDEYLILKDGADIDALVRNCEGDWQEEPPFGYQFTRDIVSLGLGGIRI